MHSKNSATFIKCITKIDGTTIDDAEDLDLAMSMYYLLEYTSNYSDITGSLSFYSKDKATNFNADIEDTNNFKCFKYKTKLFGDAVTDGNNGILINTTIAVPLQYLNNFLRSLEMLLINCKADGKLKWTNNCLLSANGNDNTDANPTNITFTIKNTRLNVPIVTLLAKDNQKLSQLLCKGFERSVYWNEHKTKNENKNTQTSIDILSNQTLWG